MDRLGDYSIRVDFEQGPGSGPTVSQSIPGPITTEKLAELYRARSMWQQQTHPYQKLLKADSVGRCAIMAEILQSPCYSTIGDETLMFAVTGLGLLTDKDAKVRELAIRMIRENYNVCRVDVSRELGLILATEDPANQAVLEQARSVLSEQGTWGLNLEGLLNAVGPVLLDPDRTHLARGPVNHAFCNAKFDVRAGVQQAILGRLDTLVLQPLKAADTSMQVIRSVLTLYQGIYQAQVSKGGDEEPSLPKAVLLAGIEKTIKDGVLVSQEADLDLVAASLSQIARQLLEQVKADQVPALLYPIGQLCEASLASRLTRATSCAVYTVSELVNKAYYSERLRTVLRSLQESHMLCYAEQRLTGNLLDRLDGSL